MTEKLLLKVHHAVIDLYEVEDKQEVNASDVCGYTGLSLVTVETALNTLEVEFTIKRDGNGVVTMAKNNGYFPLAAK